MINYQTIMIDGVCSECGTKATDNLSCHELFNFPLAWEHNDSDLYALHFWLVSCYMIQHLSSFTEEGCKGLLDIFIEAYDNEWDELLEEYSYKEVSETTGFSVSTLHRIRRQVEEEIK